jgi:hypothetical protein
MDVPRKRIAVAALAMLAPMLAGADDLPPEVLLVSHALQANRKLFTQLPNYTCLETISRARPTRDRQKLQKQDVIHLDVGVGSHTEIYSWPGDATFSSKDLMALVGHGMLASGLFQSFADGLFVQNSALVRTAGTTVIDGRKALHFTFSIPSLQNRWQVNWVGARGWLGERGEFWVDPSDLTLLRLDLAATDIPYNIPLRSLIVSIDYRILFSGGERVLIPQSAELQARETNGTLHEESIGFSQCRAFEAESNLVTASSLQEDLTTSIKHYEAQREILPGGILFSVSLETPLQAGRTNVGDPISAVLDRTVKTKTEETIPKGAILQGRVREFGRFEDPPNTFIVGLEFDELIWPGHAAAFLANLFSLQPVTGVELNLSRFQGAAIARGTFQENRTNVVDTAAIAIPGVASFFLHGLGAALPRGFRMTWRTQDAARH